MRIFGLEITRAKAMSQVPGSGRGSWMSIHESFPGAWQRNIEVKFDSVVTNHAVFACVTLAASDLAKLRVKLVELGEDGVWSEVESPAYSPVLRKPNDYQTRIQFFESWFLSKLLCGNTYILKARDLRGVVKGLHVLDPRRVRPLVSDDGEVFYQLSTDALSGVGADVTVPAREIIHDRFNCLFHPLVGLSPIYANGLAATQGLHIQTNSANFFGNQSRPSGILSAPDKIDPEDAKRLKEGWEENYSAGNIGRVAVLGSGLKFDALALTAEASQLVEQLKWTAEIVCSTFHVPPYKIGVGQMPTYNNIQSLNVEYYSQCLQSLIEAAELCLDDGLGIGAGEAVGGKTYGTEFDIDGLLRMDSLSQLEVLEKAKSVLTLDERRKKMDAKPMKTGGDTVYLQQQDHSIEAIAARDKLLIEQANAPPPAEVAPAAPPPEEPANDNSDEARAMRSVRRRMMLAARVGLASVPVN